MSKCDKGSCMCNMNFDDDNGYEYILNELKDIKARTDKVISLMEARKEKDSIINQVLNTEYEDENQRDLIPVDDLIKALISKRALRQSHPWSRKNETNDIWYTWF